MKKAGTTLRMFKTLLLSFLLTGLYFLVVYRNLPFIYDINDDVAMRNVAAGVITGVPDAHLLHIKYLLGLVISGLYRTLPGWDWYGLVMIAIMLFAFSMVLYRGLAAEKSLFGRQAIRRQPSCFLPAWDCSTSQPFSGRLRRRCPGRRESISSIPRRQRRGDR